MRDFEPPAVVALFTARAAGEPMQSHPAIEVVPGFGIPGDRYATRSGHWSDPKWRDQQLTLVSAELLDELGLGHDALRRNVVTRGMDLDDLIGLEFGIGTARLRGRRLCSPCAYVERLNKRPGLFEELAGRGGIRVSIVGAGRIEVGDELRILGPGDEIVDD
jgi:MOSC domain-containing protein YiiM